MNSCKCNAIPPPRDFGGWISKSNQLAGKSPLLLVTGSLVRGVSCSEAMILYDRQLQGITSNRQISKGYMLAVNVFRLVER